MRYLNTIKVSFFRIVLISIIILTFHAFAPPQTFARLGGGHSYSSGRSSYGGSSRSYSSSRSSYGGGYSSSRSRSYGGGSYSSSGSGGSTSGTVIIFILFIGLKAIIFMFSNARSSIFKRTDNTEYTHDNGEEQRERDKRELTTSLDNLKTIDPNFSKVLFLDFARLLFTRYIKAQGKQNTKPNALEPFLSKWAYEELCKKRSNDGAIGITKISNLIIGKLEIKHIDEGSEWMQISVHFFCNFDEYTDLKPQGRTMIRDYTVYFNRAKSVLSPGPEVMRSLHCPACGSPLSDDIQGVCASCGQAAAPGTTQWQIRHLTCDSMATEPIAEHTSSDGSFKGIEISVPLDTPQSSIATSMRAEDPPSWVRDPMIGANLRELKARDEEFSVEDFKDKVYELFYTLQKAWSGPDFEESRSIQTESLYLTHLFWIDSYRKKGQKNILADPEILGTAIVAIDCDAYYDSIKVFMNASGKDYTVNANGDIVSGDPNRGSSFCELWTFIRSVPGKHDSSDMSSCPNCGGHLDNASSSECPYCGSILRGSKFPWILAFIEQLN